MITDVRQCKTRERTQICTYVHGYSNTMHACDTVVKKVPSVEIGGGGGQTIAPRYVEAEGLREGDLTRSMVFWEQHSHSALDW